MLNCGVRAFFRVPQMKYNTCWVNGIASNLQLIIMKSTEPQQPPPLNPNSAVVSVPPLTENYSEHSLNRNRLKINHPDRNIPSPKPHGRIIRGIKAWKGLIRRISHILRCNIYFDGILPSPSPYAIKRIRLFYYPTSDEHHYTRVAWRKIKDTQYRRALLSIAL